MKLLILLLQIQEKVGADGGWTLQKRKKKKVKSFEEIKSHGRVESLIMISMGTCKSKHTLCLQKTTLLLTKAKCMQHLFSVWKETQWWKAVKYKKASLESCVSSRGITLWIWGISDTLTTKSTGMSFCNCGKRLNQHESHFVLVNW